MQHEIKPQLIDLYAVSRETLDRLAIYETLLQEHGQTLSLVGRSTLDNIWQRHFLDSAQLWPCFDVNAPLLDMGTGAGFPGLVLAMMGAGDVHLAENNQQKVAFLHEVAKATATKVTIHNCKAEALPPIKFKTITARALSNLDQLLFLGEKFFAKGAEGLFLKGAKADEEIAEARKAWDFSLSVTTSRTSEQSSILHLSRIKRKTAT